MSPLTEGEISEDLRTVIETFLLYEAKGNKVALIGFMDFAIQESLRALHNRGFKSEAEMMAALVPHIPLTAWDTRAAAARDLNNLLVHKPTGNTLG
ncbi:MAG TPA: hypothetical protein VFR09_00265 [Alphaproteobacteria bacterium]|nr:hypothetical protein [Alphaproteobacteria bacterium]